MNSKIKIPIIVGVIIAIGAIIVIVNQESNQMEVEDVLDRELTPETRKFIKQINFEVNRCVKKNYKRFHRLYTLILDEV